MKVKSWLASIFLIAITTAAWGQQSTAPAPAAPQPVAAQPVAPKPAAAQSLPAVMQQIQTELNKVGKLSFVVSVSNADEKGTSNVLVENSNVVADPASCTIRYHWWSSIHGAVVNDDDVSLSLRDAKGVWTMSNDELLKKQIAKEGTPADQTKGFYQRYVPAMYMVLIRIGNDDDNDGGGFSFTDQKQAQRVGKAVAQAVKLCGGALGPF
jgi:hypothetical protein